MLTSVTTAKKVRMPTTTYTIRVWALATSLDPTTLTAVITTMISTAKNFSHAVLSSANPALA
jgi:hypothetical protein